MTTTDTAPYVDALTAANLPAWLRWRVEIRPRRRSLGMTIEPGGAVIIAVPPAATPAKVATSVAANLGKLAGKVRRAEEIAPAYPVKELIHGEGFSWLGRSHRLRLVDAEPKVCCQQCKQPVTAHPGAPVVAERQPGGSWGHGVSWQLTLRRDVANKYTLIRWYFEQGEAWARERAEQWIGRLRVDRAGLTIRVGHIGKTRWGVYDPKTHTVTLHWALFQLESNLVEYVLVHELVHAALRGEGSHGPEWQRRMDRAMCDWDERKTAMVEPGRHVWMGEVTEAADAASTYLPTPGRLEELAAANRPTDPWADFFDEMSMR